MIATCEFTGLPIGQKLKFDKTWPTWIRSKRLSGVVAATGFAHEHLIKAKSEKARQEAQSVKERIISAFVEEKVPGTVDQLLTVPAPRPSLLDGRIEVWMAEHYVREWNENTKITAWVAAKATAPRPVKVKEEHTFEITSALGVKHRVGSKDFIARLAGELGLVGAAPGTGLAAEYQIIYRGADGFALRSKTGLIRFGDAPKAGSVAAKKAVKAPKTVAPARKASPKRKPVAKAAAKPASKKVSAKTPRVVDDIPAAGSPMATDPVYQPAYVPAAGGAF